MNIMAINLGKFFLGCALANERAKKKDVLRHVLWSALCIELFFGGFYEIK